MRHELAKRKWGVADLARHTGLDPTTISDFLDGTRWPRARTLAKIDEAFGWPAGALDTTSRSEELPNYGDEVQGVPKPSPSDSLSIVIQVNAAGLENLTSLELDEARAAATMAFLGKLREIQRDSTLARLTDRGLNRSSTSGRTAPPDHEVTVADGSDLDTGGGASRSRDPARHRPSHS